MGKYRENIQDIYSAGWVMWNPVNCSTTSVSSNRKQAWAVHKVSVLSLSLQCSSSHLIGQDSPDQCSNTAWLQTTYNGLCVWNFSDGLFKMFSWEWREVKLIGAFDYNVCFLLSFFQTLYRYIFFVGKAMEVGECNVKVRTRKTKVWRYLFPKKKYLYLPQLRETGREWSTYLLFDFFSLSLSLVLCHFFLDPLDHHSIAFRGKRAQHTAQIKESVKKCNI